MSLTGVSANRLELLQIADAVAREKSIDKEIVIEAIEEAIQKGARARYGAEHDIRVSIDPKTGETTIKRVITVVEDDAVFGGGIDEETGEELPFEEPPGILRLAEGRKRFRGVLAGIEGDQVGLDLEGEAETAMIPLAWIVEAKLVLNDELMKRGAEQRAARLEQAAHTNDNDDQEEDAAR